MSDSYARHQTYVNYVEAFLLAARKQEDLIEQQAELSAFQKLCRGLAILDQLKRPLYRSWLTVSAMNVFTRADLADSAAIANFWAPVQAYYAIHGAGMAALVALGTDAPHDHRAFRAALVQQVVRRLFPRPFSITCQGMVVKPRSGVHFENTAVTLDEALQEHNLRNPWFNNPEALVAKALMTTRRHLLEDLLAKVRTQDVAPGRKRRNISPAKRSRIADKLQPTSIVDFLYRFRKRTNYDDPRMFIHGQGDSREAHAHYRRLYSLTTVLVKLFEKIVEKKVGQDAFGQLKKQFKQEPR